MSYYPPQNPNAPTTPGSYQPIQTQPPRKKRLKWWHWTLIILGALLVLFIILGAIGAAIGPQPSTASTNPTNAPTSSAATSVPTHASQPTHAVVPTPRPTPTPKPTPTPRPIYPPRTQSDLQALAAKGDANQIHEFHSESTGLTGACPQPKREVTVDSSITGQQLAQDLLAYFYANQIDSPCGSLVLAYHSQDEADAGPYTAGRINLDVTNASGQVNVDPNATGLKYTLTLDIGGILTTQQEYVVSYTK